MNEFAYDLLIRHPNETSFSRWSRSNSIEEAERDMQTVKRVFGSMIASDIHISIERLPKAKPESETSATQQPLDDPFQTRITVYKDPNADTQPILAPYKAGTVRDGALRAKARGEDIGIYDEAHPFHHLIADWFYAPPGDAAFYYCPYLPEFAQVQIDAANERARQDRIDRAVAKQIRNVLYGRISASDPSSFVIDDAKTLIDGLGRLGFEIVEKPPAPVVSVHEDATHPWHHLVLTDAPERSESAPADDERWEHLALSI